MFIGHHNRDVPRVAYYGEPPLVDGSGIWNLCTVNTGDKGHCGWQGTNQTFWTDEMMQQMDLIRLDSHENIEFYDLRMI